MITSYVDNVSALGSFRKDISFLPTIDEYSMESFMRMYLTRDNQFFFNLLSTKISFDGEFDASTYYTITVTRKIPWTTVSYNEYRNMNLWWLICVVNNIINPVEYPVPGTKLKILYPTYVRQVIDIINQKVK
jgi:hypothetical protein